MIKTTYTLEADIPELKRINSDAVARNHYFKPGLLDRPRASAW
jgi:hypothetical protein